MKTIPLILLFVASVALSGQIEIDFSLPRAEVLMTEFQGRDLVRFEGGNVCFEEGYPNLPGATYACVIPQGTSLVNIEVIIEEMVILDGSFDIDPVRVQAFGEASEQPVETQYFWMSNELFPASHVVGISNGNKTGYRIGGFTFVPFRYYPPSGELAVITSAKLVATYEADQAVPFLCLTANQTSVARQTLETWIHNPEMLEIWSPSLREGRTGDTDWVVIAADYFLNILDPLVSHRQNLGATADAVSVEWICDNYPGYDTQEQIRNYLKDCYENRGLVFILIVGEHNQPLETVRISDIVMYGYGLHNISDLYYSDLDGTWDGDGDHKYGELSDGLDYYSDIYVGRFPATNGSELSVMVAKTIGYETDPPTGPWRTHAMLLGALILPEYNYHGDVQCDSILKRLPEDWDVDVLLEDPETGWNPTNQIEIWNEGLAFVEPASHGSERGLWWFEPVDDMITNSHISSMTNGDMLPFIQSFGCMPGKITYNDCFGEWLLKWPDGGSIANRFNSGLGWGNPPEPGASVWPNIYLADLLFTEGQYCLGLCHGASKDMVVPMTLPMKEYALQELNFFGDPLLAFITRLTGVEEEQGGGSTSALRLGGIYPNPFSSTAHISFELANAGEVTVDVFDFSGRLIEHVSEGMLQAGGHSIQLGSEALSSGVYFVRVSVQGTSATRRCVLIR